jgi:hypothetical protein
MSAFRESVCTSLGNRIQLLTDPLEAWELMKTNITDEDEHAWISRVEHLRVDDFKTYLEFLDALQVLFNNMEIYVPGKKDWTEERVVKCGVPLRFKWDDWESVLEFYSELEDKIKEAEGKEFAGYTMRFFFKKVAVQVCQADASSEGLSVWRRSRPECGHDGLGTCPFSSSASSTVPGQAVFRFSSRALPSGVNVQVLPCCKLVFEGRFPWRSWRSWRRTRTCSWRTQGWSPRSAVSTTAVHWDLPQLREDGSQEARVHQATAVCQSCGEEQQCLPDSGWAHVVLG